jgi:hypothetical protein
MMNSVSQLSTAEVLRAAAHQIALEESKLI